MRPRPTLSRHMLPARVMWLASPTHSFGKSMRRTCWIRLASHGLSPEPCRRGRRRSGARPEIQLGAFAMPRWDWQPGATRGRRLPHPSEVPRRIRYRPCRTLVFPPAGWDARRAIARSSRPPSAQLELEWIHGYEIGLCGMVSANLCCVAAATPGEPRAERRLVFAAAAVIVVFDLGGLLDTEPTKDDGGDGDGLPTPPTSQRYFRGHDDNVTCVTLNATGTLGVSGQVGARPVVLVWDVVTLEQTHAFGRGFYQAGIAVLFFSPDDALVAAVGSDVNHTLGVWRLETRGEGVAVGALRLGEKTAETLDRAAVYGGCWMARKGFALNRGVPLGDESEKVEDTFVTVGYGKHVRFWELQQPDEARVARVDRHRRRTSRIASCDCIPRWPTKPNCRSRRRYESSPDACCPLTEPPLNGHTYDAGVGMTTNCRCLAQFLTDAFPLPPLPPLPPRTDASGDPGV